MDTEIYDNLNGHVTTVDSSRYFGQFAGWYLAQGVAPFDYTGGSGAGIAGIGFAPGGGSVVYYRGQRMPLSGTGGERTAPVAAKLVEMTNIGGTGSGVDYVTLAANQSSGATQNLRVDTKLFPEFHVKWVCRPTGTVVSSLPLGYSAQWPLPQTSLTAQANAGVNSISVASATGLMPLGNLGLETGTANGETVTIGSLYTPGSLTVPVFPNTSFAHASGAPVNVPVSAAFCNTAIRDTVRRILYPPIMEAYYNAGSATLSQQSALPAVGSIVPCDTTRVDNYSAFNTSSHVWVCPVAGTYWCYFQCHQAMNSTSLSLAAGLTVTSQNYNSGTQTTLWGGAQAAFSGGDMLNCAVVRRRLRLNSGDIVAGCAFQHDSGAASTSLDFGSSGGTAFNESRLIIVWAGV